MAVMRMDNVGIVVEDIDAKQCFPSTRLRCFEAHEVCDCRLDLRVAGFRKIGFEERNL